MYETISCTLLPPRNQTTFEFEEQLRNGNRPNFSENVLVKLLIDNRYYLNLLPYLSV